MAQLADKPRVYPRYARNGAVKLTTVPTLQSSNSTALVAEGEMTSKAEAVSRVENGEVRVTEWRFAPGAETGWHRHEYDYVVVPLMDGRLRIVANDGESTAELEQGTAYFRKAGSEHNVINASDKDLAFVDVELVEHPG
jgi:quercetin dioxygenase-like cupin family protein